MHPTLRLFTGLILALTVAAPTQSRRQFDRSPDVLIPARGRDVEGYLVRMDGDRVHFQVESRDEFFDREEVETIRSPLLLYPELADRLRRSRPGDIQGAIDVAEWCRDVGLEEEETYAWWRVLAYDWQNTAAHQALGSKEKSRGWQVRVDRRYYYRDKLYKRIADWKNALEIDIELFRVRSSARLEDTFDAMAAMVRGYETVYELFGELMDLPYPREVVVVQLHGSSDSYPPLNNRSAYYEPDENRIVADVTLWEGAGTMVHEVTHAILTHTYRMIDDGRGAAPPWLQEGMAEHVACEIEAQDGGIDDRYETQRALFHLSNQVDAEEPIELDRLLNSSIEDYHDLYDSQEFYAAAFSLVLFLMEADDQAYRGRFEEYLAGTFEGKFSTTDFANIMGKGEMEEFEERWHAWARGRLKR